MITAAKKPVPPAFQIATQLLCIGASLASAVIAVYQFSVTTSIGALVLVADVIVFDLFAVLAGRSVLWALYGCAIYAAARIGIDAAIPSYWHAQLMCVLILFVVLVLAPLRIRMARRV